ncbi:murein biosynthesis integral membrane protein MurJ [Actinoplanes siamensis]|uniref:Peptidoglycan lipid II flippase n=1 Tax=Actinoplanes siamensis TaxID=1223317 RepID=A0A919THA4_9ACTN|nr:lipid II flippase MurJ [Actinoplanes siamensis]GIF03801.1 hypothetical protein Asi03nite_13390 [Actinoplanes siamensis]
MSTPTTSDESAALLRAGRGLAIGTVVSRVTGFGRMVVLAAALGLGTELFDSYNVANTLPNVAYELVFGGVAASLIVPLVSREVLRGRAAAADYARRLISAVTGGLAAVAVLAVLAAPVLVRIYSPGLTPAQHHLAVVLSWFFLPQIVLYGLGATAAAVLNAFSPHPAPMWAPAANNVIVIAVGLAYIAAGGSTELSQLSGAHVLFLGAGTTAGVAGQVLVVLGALRRQGVPLRLRWDLTGIGLRRTARLGVWVLLSVAANQAAYTMAVRSASHLGAGGVSAYQAGYAIFHVPYAVAAVSVNTAALPRMSRAAAVRDTAGLAAQLSRSLRVIFFVTAPAGVTLFALGPVLSELLFAHGNSTAAAVGLAGSAARAFGPAVVPFAAYAALLAGLHALQDTRAVALLNLLVGGLAVAGFTASVAVLPAGLALSGVAGTYAVAYSCGCAAAGLLLYRRLPGARPGPLARGHLRPLAAALAAGGAELAVAGAAPARPLLSVTLAAAAGAAVYLCAAGNRRRVLALLAGRGRTRPV